MTKLQIEIIKKKLAIKKSFVILDHRKSLKIEPE